MNLFHSDEMIDLWRSQSGFEVVVVRSLHGDIEVGRLVCLIIKEQGVKEYFSRRCIVWGGPVIHEIVENKYRVCQTLLLDFLDEIKGKAIYIEFRNLTDQRAYKEIYQKLGFEYEDHLNIIVDLTKAEEKLWKDLSTKRRNEI